jgi:hypothetical protein
LLSLRRFLDVAYAILVEEYQRLGIDLLTAIEKLGDFAAGTRETDGQSPTQEAVEPSERDVVRQNQLAMAELTKLMGGVGA